MCNADHPRSNSEDPSRAKLPDGQDSHPPPETEARPPRKRGKKNSSTQRISLSELFTSDEFRRDLMSIADCAEQKKSGDLRTGRLAKKWIGDSRYSRVLNVDIFARALKDTTGRELTGRRIRDYMSAATTQEILEKAGVPCDKLSVSHLEEIGKSGCDSDEDRIELARRVNEKDLSARQVRRLANRLLSERRQERHIVDIVPTKARVQVIDGLELARQQADGSIECAIMDGNWLLANWGNLSEGTPNDAIQHICECLGVLKSKLSPDGTVFLFHPVTGFMDARISATCHKAGFQHVGKLIAQKKKESLHAKNSLLRIAHDEIHLIRHAGHTHKPVSRRCSTVTAKLPSRPAEDLGLASQYAHVQETPVELMDMLIGHSTVNGLVVDFFAGIGSAGVAAVRRGCPYVGAESVPEIAEIADRRIALAHGENEEVVEAVNFFLEAATDEQFAVITTALEKCSLRCVRKVLGRAAA